jgi:hypothetical protein
MCTQVFPLATGVTHFETYTMAEGSNVQKGILQSRAWRLFASVALLFLLGMSSGCK